MLAIKMSEDEIVKLYKALAEIQKMVWSISSIFNDFFRLQHTLIAQLGQTWILSSDFGTKNHLEELEKLHQGARNSLEEVSNVMKKMRNTKDVNEITRLWSQYEILSRIYLEKSKSFINYFNKLLSEYASEMLSKKELK